jgi:hypothetical protein
MQNNSNVKGSGQECPLHDISVILRRPKEPCVVGPAAEDERRSHEGAGKYRTNALKLHRDGEGFGVLRFAQDDRAGI